MYAHYPLELLEPFNPLEPFKPFNPLEPLKLLSMSHYIKHYPFTWFIFAIVMILSFMPVPETPLSDVAFIDKWTHIVMYFGQAGAIWLDHLRLHGLRFSPIPHGLRVGELRPRRLRIGALYLPSILGGLVELGQKYCTNGLRSGDWIDWVADIVGVVIAWVLCLGYVRLLANKRG